MRREKREPETLEILSVLTAAERIRFWKSIGIGQPDVCWPYLMDDLYADGYATFSVRSYGFRAHRVAWTLFHNKEIGSLFACHACDNRWCNNPHHIWLGTQADNMKDAGSKGRMHGRIRCFTREEWREKDEANRNAFEMAKLVVQTQVGLARAVPLPMADPPADLNVVLFTPRKHWKPYRRRK